MILSKQYLNELVQKGIIQESISIKHSESFDTLSYDVFLSYSSGDKEYAIKVMQLLQQCGYTVYIDVADDSLNKNRVTAKTAKILAKRMDKCKGLLYLHSSRASVSKWCPWELGYFTGAKKFRCAKLPLKEKDNNPYEGQEYLEIYYYVDYATHKSSNENDFWVNNDNGDYVTLKQWLNGTEPYKHI